MNSSTPALPSTPDSSRVIMTFMLQLVCMSVLLFGIIGNGFVIVIFGRRYSDLKTYEVYMLSLAAADFIGTLLFPSIQLHAMHGGDFRGLGAIGCKLIYFLLTCSITSSAMTLIVISFDRFIIVKWPLRERLPPFTLGYTITIPWLLGICHGMLYLVGDRMILKKEGQIYVCRTQFTEVDMQVFTVATFIVQNLLPVMLMLIIYTCIVRILYKSATIFNFSGRELYARDSRNKKALKLLLTVISVFFVCTTPHNIFHIWYVYHFDVIDLSAYYPIYMLVTMCYACNSCFNPLIYARLHDKFRQDILSLICCRKKVRHRINKYLTLATSSTGWFSRKKVLSTTMKSKEEFEEEETHISSDSSIVSTQLERIFIEDHVLKELENAKETVL